MAAGHGRMPNKRGKKVFGNRRWTEEEDQVLREFYAKDEWPGYQEDLAKGLGRTRIAVSLRAMALGLTKSSGLLRHRSPKRLAADKASGARSKASGKVCSMAEDEARELFERYKKSKLGVVAFSLSNGFYSEGLSRAFRKHFPDEYEDAKEAKAIKRDCWYRVGRRYEYEVGNLMRGDGWVVMRSPGSKSPADLIAIRDGCVALVQCKRGASTLSKKEKKALVAMATKAGGLPILACKVGRAGDTRFRLCTSDGYSPWDAH